MHTGLVSRIIRGLDSVLTMFVKDGLDGKKNARQIRGRHENVHIQNFKKELQLDGFGRLPLHPFYGQRSPDLIQRLAIKGVWE